MFKKILTFFFDVSSSNWHHKLFLYGLYISYLLFFIAFTGIVSLSPTYLSNLESWIKYYVCFILLIRFNPFIYKKEKNNINSEFDRHIAFSAGVFLLFSSSLMDIIQNYISKKIPLVNRLSINNSK